MMNKMKTHQPDAFDPEMSTAEPGLHPDHDRVSPSAKHGSKTGKQCAQLAHGATAAPNGVDPEMSTATQGTSNSHDSQRHTMDEMSLAQPTMYQPQYQQTTPHGASNASHFTIEQPPPYTPTATPYCSAPTHYQQPMIPTTQPLMNVAQPMVFPQPHPMILQGHETTTMALATGNNTVVVTQPNNPVAMPQNAGYPDNKRELMFSCFTIWGCWCLLGCAAFIVASHSSQSTTAQQAREKLRIARIMNIAAVIFGILCWITIVTPASA